MLLVGNAAAQIGLGSALLRRGVGGSANQISARLLTRQRALGVVDTHGAWTGRRQRDARRPDGAAGTQRHLDGGRCGREVADFAFNLLIRAGGAIVRNRKPRLDRDLTL